MTLNDAYHHEVKQYLWNIGITDIDDSFTVSQTYFFREIYREIFEKRGVDISGDVLSVGAFQIPNPYLGGGRPVTVLA